MKNLILIRHAKSSWDDPALSDRERPLNKRGKKDAPELGLLLKAKGLLPDLILSSPAKRALKTAKMIADEIDYPKKRIEVREELYEQGVKTLIELIGELDEGLERVFLIGHNPDLTDLANRLTAANIDNVPTCGMVSVVFSMTRWKQCALQGGRLALFERPVKAKGGNFADEDSLTAEINGTEATKPKPSRY